MGKSKRTRAAPGSHEFWKEFNRLRESGEYKGAQWMQVPCPHLIAAKLSAEQIRLYVYLASEAETRPVDLHGNGLRKGYALFRARKYGRESGRSDRSVRRDLEALKLAFLINLEGRTGNDLLIYILPTASIPAVGIASHKSTPHLDRFQLLVKTAEMLGFIISGDRVVPHLAPHLEREKKALKEPLLKETAEGRAALRAALDSNIRKKVLEATHRENTLTHSEFTEEKKTEGDATPSLKNVGLYGPLDARDGPSGPSETERSPSASQSNVVRAEEALNLSVATSEVSGSDTASEGVTFDLDPVKGFAIVRDKIAAEAFYRAQIVKQSRERGREKNAEIRGSEA